MPEIKSQCDTCFWQSAGGWCTKGWAPVKHKEPVANCENYIHRLGDFDKARSGLTEE